MRRILPVVLALNAGFVDTAGFLALHGLFTTHVTGNFVTLGASLVLGTSGALAKLLALPLFCVVVIFSRLLGSLLDRLRWPGLRIMFGLEAALLALGGWLAVRYGPFPDGDAWPALATGGALVSAMAIQNAVHRVRLASLPPSTVMTGTTTQVMVDLADVLRRAHPEKRAAAKKRLGPMSLSVAAFAGGCAAGALGYTMFRELCFAAPPVAALLALAFASAADPAEPPAAQRAAAGAADLTGP
jgi:uncharacterized membrane protein YoaK (UPF0700 family)